MSNTVVAASRGRAFHGLVQRHQHDPFAAAAPNPAETRTAMAAAGLDIPLLVSSDNASSERRITPSWTVAHLKARLEPITGVPASCQRLLLKVASQPPQPIEAADEDATQLARWPLQAYAEIQVGRLAPGVSFI